MLSRRVVVGIPEAAETREGVTGARSRTWVSTARRYGGSPVGSSCVSTIRPTSWDVVPALRKSCLSAMPVRFVRSAHLCVLFTASTHYLPGGSDETVTDRCRSASLLAAIAGEAGGSRAATDSWVGTYRLGGQGQISLTVSGKRAFVALGVGHADMQSVPLSASGPRLRFHLPGRPTPLVFEGTVVGGKLTGTARQGALRGTFSARRGNAPSLVARGFYGAGGGQSAVVDDPYGPARIVDLDSGRVRAIYPTGAGFSIGSGFATRAPNTGTARFGTGAAVIDDKQAARCACVSSRCSSGAGPRRLSGTLLIPPGAGKHAGAVFVHGSGPTERAYLPELSAMLVRRGVAVLVYDKRGIGQSDGRYPGESPTEDTIDTLSRDAQAAARFLAVQPEIDPKRVGLTGHSQAGWIAPLAAAREPAIRFLLVFSGPAVTADENDLFQDLAGQGDRTATLTDAEIDAQVLKAGPGGSIRFPRSAS